MEVGPKSPEVSPPFSEVSCHGASASERRIGIRNPLVPLTQSSTVDPPKMNYGAHCEPETMPISQYDTMTHRSTVGGCQDHGIPRTSEGAPDVEEMLRRVRSGWPGPGGSPWALPGTGSPGPKCGINLGSAQACLDCTHRWAVLTSCRAWVCPGCAPKKVRQQAMATAIRVGAVRDTLVMEHGQGAGLKIRRAVISPAPERSRMAMDYDHGLATMGRLRTQAREVAESKGFQGGVMVFHPWRDRQTWEFKYAGPHFHIIGPAHWLEEGDGADGWLFKASPSRLRTGGVYDRLTYDLSHVGVYPSKPVVTYWGAMNGRKVRLAYAVLDRIKALEEHRTHVCPACSSINTRAIVPTLEELERWGIMRPLERHHREVQNRFKCDDCGNVDGLEPVPKVRVDATRPVNPWEYDDPDRQEPTPGSHWTDGDLRR